MSRLPIVSTSLNLEDLNERIEREKWKQKLFRERIRSTLRDTTRDADRNKAMSDALEFVGSSSKRDTKDKGKKVNAIDEVFTDYEVKAKFHEIMESEVRKFANPELSNRDLELISKLVSENKDMSSETKIKVGETVVHDTKGLAVVRYIGEAPMLGPGIWYGLELKEKKFVIRGKGEERWLGQGLGDGSLMDNGRWVYYFKCEHGSALFVRREHIKGSKNATTVIASAHKTRTARVAIRVGFGSRDKAELETGSLDNTSVFYVVIPEYCTFESFQHNVAMILGVQPGVVVIEAWGYESNSIKRKSKEGNEMDFYDKEEHKEEDKERMMPESAATKIPTKFRFKASDCVVEFLHSKVIAPSGAYAEWSDEKSILPTLAVTLKRVEMSRAQFWLTHPQDLAHVFDMISHSSMSATTDGDDDDDYNDEDDSNDDDDDDDDDDMDSDGNGEKTKRRGHRRGEDLSRRSNQNKKNQDEEDKIENLRHVRKRMRKFRKESRDPKQMFEDYVLFKKYGSVVHIDDEDYDSDEFENEHQIEVQLDRDIEKKEDVDGEEKLDDSDALYEGGGNNGVIEKIEDEEVLKLYLKHIEDPQERERVAERLRSNQTKAGARREAKRLRSRLGLNKLDEHRKRDREERNFGIDRHEFVNVLKIWSLKEKTFGVRLELVDFYSTIKMPLEDPLEFDSFLLGLRSIRTGINESAARDLFRKMDYKKRGYVTYQQMSEFWDDICNNLIDADSTLLLSSIQDGESGRSAEKKNLDMPMFMRSEKEKSTRVYAPLSAEKKHITRKICWLFLLLILWTVTFGLNVVTVQDRYQYRRSFLENIIERPFLDVSQTAIAGVDIHIQFMDISSTKQALNFIVQIVDPYYKTYGTFTPTISDQDTFDFLQKTDKNLNTVVASKLTIRQLRTELNQNCATETGVYIEERDCTGPYKKKNRLTSFGGDSSAPDTSLLNCTSPSSASDATTCALSEGWTFYEPSLNDASVRIPGVVAEEYDFSGFRMTFDLDTEYDFLVLAQGINTYEWFDNQTSAVILHISLFNPSLNAFEDTWLLMEMSPYGVVYPSFYLGHADASTLLDNTVQKVKVAVYIWSTIVHIFAIRRMIKRWKFVDFGLVLTDSAHSISLLVATAMYFAMYLNTYRERIVNDFSSLEDLQTYLTSNEQVLLLLENSQQYVNGVELFMLGLTAFQVLYCVILLSRRSAIGIAARSFWGSNLVNLLSYYIMLLLGIAMITTFVQPRLRTNVSEYRTSLEGFKRIFASMMSGLTTDELSRYRKETGYVENQSRVSVTTILVVALVALRLFALPLFRAIVAQNYMKERFATRYEESEKHEKHNLKQYFIALADVFGGSKAGGHNMNREAKLMRSALKDVDTRGDHEEEEEEGVDASKKND